MRKPLSSTSARPLRSADSLDVFVPRAETALAQCRAFAVTGPFTWNDLPLPQWPRTMMAVVSPTFSQSLKVFLFDIAWAGSASE